MNRKLRGVARQLTVGRCISQRFAFLLICIFLPGSIACAQDAVDMASDPHHELLLENEQVRVFEVSLRLSQRSYVRHEHNFLMVTLQSSELVMWPEGRSDIQNFHLGVGDVRFFFGGRSRGLRNDQGGEYRGVTVEFPNPKVTTYGYQTDSGKWSYGDSVLNPPVDPKAKYIDTMQLGEATATDVQLLPGDVFPAPEKAAELIVAVTDVDLKDESNDRFRKSSGEVVWISAEHKTKLTNNGTDSARFVVVELQ
jgi:hypothetical protein